MHQGQLRARPECPRPPPDSGLRAEHFIAPNLQERQFEANKPTRKRVADLPCIVSGEGGLHRAVVRPLFSRRIVAGSMQPTMTAQLALGVLLMALWRRGKPSALLHPSDQGRPCTSDDLERLLSDQRIPCGIPRSGHAWNNVALERFSSSLKRECGFR
jgi:putative transposase